VPKIYKWLAGFMLLGIFATIVIHYFQVHSLVIFNPHGVIAQKERGLIIFALLLSLIVIVPVFTMLFLIAWKYRASNTKAKYSPEFDHSRIAETTWWTIPSVLILILSIVTWNSSHALDPYRPLNASVKPLLVQVVALDWKWLFIYPQQNLASVNLVELPVNTPVTFQITADAPMNSFWIPQLGGQVYAMPGMSTELHLEANKAGDYAGSSANISGSGFADMKFTARAVSANDFGSWSQAVKQAPSHLMASTYAQLAKPSRANPVAYYSNVQNNLYNNTVMKFMMPMTANDQESL
jgi:cytochrome o ubiquinol oxidase subunit II